MPKRKTKLILVPKLPLVESCEADPVEKIADILSKQPHMQGRAVCLECKHTWQAVTPVGVTEFQCPKCSLMKGVFNSVVFPETAWQCKCGNCLFSLSITAFWICAHCGEKQVFP